MINNMRILVRVTADDQINNDYKKGESGIIDGYVRGADGRPYACVVIDTRIVMIPLNCLFVTL